MSGHIDARPRMFQEASFCDDPEAADLTGRPGRGRPRKRIRSATPS